MAADDTDPEKGASDVAAILTRADTAIGGGDGKGALVALGEAIVAAAAAKQQNGVVTGIVSRIIDVHRRVPAEVETAVSMLARAEEHFGATREIVEARASIHESAGHHEAAFGMLQRLAALVPDDVAKAVV